jgi:hypothetical protein
MTMIRILRYESGNDTTTQCIVEDEDSKIKLTFRNSTEEYIVSLDKNKSVGKIYNIVLCEGKERKIVVAYEKYGYFSRSIFPTAPSGNEEKLAQVFIGNVDIIIGLMFGCSEVKDFENIIIEEDETMTNAFCRISSEYEEATRPLFAKFRMINKVDIYNSVTYLESQVDTLTRIILKLYNENDKLRELLVNADKYSVLDIKDNDVILGEIERDKKNIRNLQKEYYEDKKEKD